MQSRGLGDTIEKITTFSGIKAIIESISLDCGCPYRRDWLNGKVPYNTNTHKKILNFFKK